MNEPQTLRDLATMALARHGESGRRLAAMASAEGHKLTHGTFNQIAAGAYRYEPKPETIRAIAWLAGVSDEVAFAAAGVPMPGPPFAEELPPGVDYLSQRSRRAAVEILRALVEAEQKAGGEHDERSAPKTHAGESPAPKKRRDPFANKKPVIRGRKDPTNRGGSTLLQTLGIVDADGQVVRDRPSADEVISELIAPLVERGMSEAEAVRWLRNRAAHDAGATGFGPGLTQRDPDDERDPEDYVLAASDVDDEPEVEAWQEEP